MKNIDIDISTEIFRLVNFWNGFFKANERYASISGQYLKNGDNRIMTIYRQGKILYEEGIKDIEKLRSCEIRLLKAEISSDEVENTLEIAYKNRDKADNFSQNYFSQNN